MTDGEGEVIRSINPFDPDDIVAETGEASGSEISATLDLAVQAQREWRVSAIGRSDALLALAAAIDARSDEFVRLMVREVGKPTAEAIGEVKRAAAILRFYSQVALDPSGELFPGSVPGASVAVRREPLGVVLAICPWNFPLAIPIWKSAPALAYGNTVVIKPASPAIAVGCLLSECAEETLPPGVLGNLPMSGATAAELLDDPRIAAVTFTGSTQVGLAVSERMARRGAPAQAEMGGQNPAVVLEDANIEAAADAIVSGAMGYAGQKCTATRRVVVLESVADVLTEALVSRVRSLKVGDPAGDGVTVGPLISQSAVDEFEDRVEQALGDGAAELARADLGDESGYLVSPALLRVDDLLDPANQEETFGPLLTLIRVYSEAEAIEAANATRFGLVSSVHGADLGRAVAISSQIDTGLQRINAPTPGVDFHVPFGGEGDSSFGPREQGRAAREFFTSSRTMTIIPSPG